MILSMAGAGREWFEEAMSPFRTFNDYGLFRDMTNSRPEIIIEGSNDGENWLPYEFKWKPGDVNRRPGLVAPFQPRLDWQMWFAALEITGKIHGSLHSWAGFWKARPKRCT